MINKINQSFVKYSPAESFIDLLIFYILVRPSGLADPISFLLDKIYFGLVSSLNSSILRVFSPLESKIRFRELEV